MEISTKSSHNAIWWRKFEKKNEIYGQELREIWQRKTDGHTVDILKFPRRMEQQLQQQQ